MDPNECLNEMLKLSCQIQLHPEEYTDDAERLAELFLSLDEWMLMGGFSPWGDPI